MMHVFRGNQSGFTLLETLVGVGAAGVVIAAMATAHVAMRDNFIREQAMREAEGLRTHIEGILANPVWCARALQTGGGAVPWGLAAPQSADITSVGLTNPTATGTTPVLNANTRYSNNLLIRRMYLRRLLDVPGSYSEGIALNIGGANLDRGAAPPLAVTYIPAKLVIEVGSYRTIPLATADLKAQTVDLIVAVDNATQTVAHCASNERYNYTTNYSCNGTTITAGATCTGALFDFNCHHLYYIAGIDASGNADCRCVVVCNEQTAAQRTMCGQPGGANNPVCNQAGQPGAL